MDAIGGDAGLDCECLNGAKNGTGDPNKKEPEYCKCDVANSCIRRVSCSCVGANCSNLKNLNEACFKSGFNARYALLDENNKITDSCQCKFITDVGQVGINEEARSATPRENGLCVDLMNVNFCDHIKYYNQNKVYMDGGAGNELSYIKERYISNIWRTEQRLLGRYYFGDLGNAEFDRTVDCDRLLNDNNCCTSYSIEAGCSIKNDITCQSLQNSFCLLVYSCYYKDGNFIGQKCEHVTPNCECSYVQPGVCKGFWREKNNTIPLARCITESDEFGELYSRYKLIPNTECERFTCPTVNSNQAILSTEAAGTNFNEIDEESVDVRGSFNGFATWHQYKKGTEGMSPEDLAKRLENGFGDDIEERRAVNCLNGYGPAGLNFIRQNFIPVMANRSGTNYVELTGEADIIKTQDAILRNIIGFAITPTASESECRTGQTVYLNHSNAISKILGGFEYGMTPVATSPCAINQQISKDIGGGYFARDHLPFRHCNQVGAWMDVNDIHAKFGIALYHLKNSDIRTVDNRGFLTNAIISKFKITEPYKKAYCERLFCPKFEDANIGLLSVEGSNPVASTEKEYTFRASERLFYPNNDVSWTKNAAACRTGQATVPTNGNNYPEDPTNCSDSRGNPVVVNKLTKWRHAGGARWAETPGPRFLDSISVTGTCAGSKNFHPTNSQFFDSFSNHFNAIFTNQNDTSATLSDLNNVVKRDLKQYDIYQSLVSSHIQPTRTCSTWGQWSEVVNKCVASCEALDVFRTAYNDQNKDSVLQNHEITHLFGTPIFDPTGRRGLSLPSPNNTSNPAYFLYHYYYLTRNPLDASEEFTHLATNQNCKVAGVVVPGIKCGDVYTGGAMWPRTKAGFYAIGTCDATVGKTSTGQNPAFKTFNYNQKVLSTDPTNVKTIETEGITFIQAGKSTNIPTVSGTKPTNNAPYRECLPDGTWGPVIDPCVNALTCANYTVTTKDVITASNSASVAATAVVSSQNIATLEGGKVTLGSADLRPTMTVDCSSGNAGLFFEAPPAGSSGVKGATGTITRACDITTGNWDPIASSNVKCVLKTCGEIPSGTASNPEVGRMGSIATSLINSAAGNPGTTNGKKYYAIESQLRGAFTLNNVNYTGYEFSYECPTGYECQGCDTTGASAGQVRFTCSAKDDSEQPLAKPAWKRSGECVPITCRYADVSTMCVNERTHGLSSCATPNNLTIQSAGTITFTNGQVSTIINAQSVVANETYVKLNCNIGFQDERSTKRALCKLNTDQKTASWVISGECRQQCGNGSLPSGHNIVQGSLSAWTSQGSTYTANCSSGYIADPGNPVFSCGPDTAVTTQANSPKAVWSLQSNMCRLPRDCSSHGVSAHVWQCSDDGRGTSEAWNCYINVGSRSHNGVFDSGILGARDNIAVGGGRSDDTGLCRVRATCRDGTWYYWDDYSWLNIHNIDHIRRSDVLGAGQAWDKASSCHYPRSSWPVAALCCNT